MKKFPLLPLLLICASMTAAVAVAVAEQGNFFAAPYDPFVGDWETQTPAAPVAQVIRTGSNAYTVNVLAAFDDDSDTTPIAVLQGSLAAGADPEKDSIELSGTGSVSGGGWTGEMWPDCCSSPHLNLVNVDAKTQAKQILHLRHYARPNPLLRVKPPAGATVLFSINGQNAADAWTSAARRDATPAAILANAQKQGVASNAPTGWKLAESSHALESVPGAGAIASREDFGDQRVHLEFRFIGSPASACVLVQGVYRITLNESYARFDLPPSGAMEKTVKAGEGAAGGLAGGGIKPAARASRPVLEWQTLDIDFRAPRFAKNGNGKIQTPANATVYLNNVLLYENVELTAPIAPDGTHARETPRGPLVLEEHDAPVQFRNIWVR